MSGDFDWANAASVVWIFVLPAVIVCKLLFGSTRATRERQKIAAELKRQERALKKELRKAKPEDRATIEGKRLHLAKQRLEVEHGGKASGGLGVGVFFGVGGGGE
tara:strand:+ start:690 stop:1004 length:315 start_codon:yes stop_codon:yes gene_type:complete